MIDARETDDFRRQIYKFASIFRRPTAIPNYSHISVVLVDKTLPLKLKIFYIEICLSASFYCQPDTTLSYLKRGNLSEELSRAGCCTVGDHPYC